MDTILYEVHSGLYVNLTNKCPCACTFCLRQEMDSVGGSGPLWLSKEPSAEDVIAEFSRFDMSRYTELVFCGFGEPTEALDVLLKAAAYAKERFGIKIRVNTNGLGDLVNGKRIAPLLAGLVDVVSVSLNTPDPAKYMALVRPRFGEDAYPAMLAFAGDCASAGMQVVMTTVATTLTDEEEKQCAAICEELGVSYRIRPWEG